ADALEALRACLAGVLPSSLLSAEREVMEARAARLPLLDEIADAIKSEDRARMARIQGSIDRANERIRECRERLAKKRQAYAAGEYAGEIISALRPFAPMASRICGDLETVVLAMAEVRRHALEHGLELPRVAQCSPSNVAGLREMARLLD